MLSKIKQYIKPTLLNIGLPIATFLAVGVPINGGCNWETPKKSLEQVVNTVEPTTSFTEEQVEELIFYSAMNESIESAKGELLDFSTNLANYQMHNPDSARKFIYLARAEENLSNIGEEITKLQHKARRIEDEKLQDLLYAANGSQQGLFHNFAGCLRRVFNDESVSGELHVENYKHPTSNPDHNKLNKTLYEISRYLGNKLTD